MKIILNILVTVAFAIVLFLTVKILSVPREDTYDNPDVQLYGHGNASPEVRQQILDQLHRFQEGYEARDTSALDVFMDQLFSRNNILILGTMPGEIYSGYDEAADLLSSDWLYWGDVKLMVDNSNISAKDSVAWISTIGLVEFDLSRLLVLPLRFTGLLVREDQSWKFQQTQFQFDLDTSWVLGIILFLSICLLLSILRLVFIIIKHVINREP